MPYTIVVADPSPSVQKAAQLVFTEPEFRVYAFEDGAALLAAVDGLKPDAVVVSLTMPGRDGYQVGRAVRSRKGFEAVPLVGLRGAFEGLDADKSVPPEYDEVLAKPFDSERLAAVVRELIARKTGPATLPEEPVPPPAAAEAVRREPAPPSGERAEPAAGFKDWVRAELVGMEREIEKRVRARVAADLKEWMSGDGQGSGPKE